jgi:hypothetical protein
VSANDTSCARYQGPVVDRVSRIVMTHPRSSDRRQPRASGSIQEIPDYRAWISDLGTMTKQDSVRCKIDHAA